MIQNGDAQLCRSRSRPDVASNCDVLSAIQIRVIHRVNEECHACLACRNCDRGRHLEFRFVAAGECHHKCLTEISCVAATHCASCRAGTCVFKERRLIDRDRQRFVISDCDSQITRRNQISGRMDAGTASAIEKRVVDDPDGERALCRVPPES